MTVTLNSGHELVELREAQAGRRIGRGRMDDLRDLNRAVIHEFASNGSTALAVLSSQVGISGYSTSYSNLSAARVGLWGNGARVAMHVYCNQTRVRLTLGGVVVGAAAVVSSVNAWITLSASTLAGATFDSDGMCSLLLEVQATTGAPTGTPAVFHVIVAEEKVQAADLPAAGNTQTDFRAMHDELYATADDPVDAFAMQALHDNARRMMFERSRRCATLFPMQGGVQQIVRLSSAHWRLDGPYVLEVPPYFDDDLTVTVTIQRATTPTQSVDFFALSEFDDFETARIARTQTLSTTTLTRATFKGLIARAGQPVRVWVAFRGHVASASTTTPDCYAWNVLAPHRLHVERDATLEGAALTPDGVPWGYCIVSQSEDTAASKDPTIKASLGFSTPSQMVDIACVQGIDNQSGGSTSPALLLSISPHPGTGITRAPDFQAVMQTWNSVGSGNVSYQPTLDVRRCGIAFLYGVYIQAGGTVTPARDKAARPGQPPSAGLLEAVAQRVNNMVLHGNSQCMIRHSGQGNAKASTTLGGGQVLYYAGQYLFTEGANTSAGSYLVQVPLAEPNVSGGLGSIVLRGRFHLMGVIGDGRGFPDQSEVVYRCRFTTGGWVTGTTQARRRVTGGTQQSPTEADALVAMVSVSNEVGASPQQTTANAYGQCYTWPIEGSHRKPAWEAGVVFEDDSQPSFPTFLVAEIQAIGAGGYEVVSQLIIAGLDVWWAPREA